MHCLHAVVAAVVAAVMPDTGSASGLENPNELPEPTPIYGGEPAGACEWPATVSLGSCTATLVHPELIYYAAHCGTSYSSAFFGDSTSGQGFSVPISSCQRLPSYNGIGTGTDFAFCKLAQPVTDVPYTPPLMGCEVDVLQAGKEVWIVGFGDNDDGGYGTKYKAKTVFNYFDSSGDANVGAGGTTICYGDSGGPAYVQLTEEEGFDGSWRAFGIASYIYTPCGNEGFHAVMHRAVDWVEEASGIDITPCHDADGTWNPGPDCKEFPMDPGTGVGSWNAGCDPGPKSSFSATCGPSYAEMEDEGPPTVRIMTPSDGAVIPMDGEVANLTVTIEATDDSRVDQVELLLDGIAVGEPDLAPPWTFELSLGPGEYQLDATAIDAADNTAEAQAVTITVGSSGNDSGSDDTGDPQDRPDDDDDDDDDDDEADTDSPSVAPAGALPANYGDAAPIEGCGCRHGGPRRTPLALWLLLGLAGMSLSQRKSRVFSKH